MNRISNNSDFAIFENTKSDSYRWSYRPVNCICTKKYNAHRGSFVFCCRWSECDVTYGTLAMAAIVCWQSEADCAELKLDQMCETRLTKMSCVAQQVGIVHFYAVTEIKGLSCRLWWMREWRNSLSSTHVGCRVCHVGSSEWRVTKIWGLRC